MRSGHSVADAAGVILAMDEAVSDLLRRPRRLLVGTSYLEITHPADRQRNRAQIDALSPGASPFAIRKRYLRGDGSLVWVDLTVARASSGADAERLVGTIRWPGDAHRIAPDMLWQAARALADEIMTRRLVLGDDLFADHAWMILLDLYLAEAEGQVVDADAISRRTTTPIGTVRRWMKALGAKALVEHCGKDRRHFQLSNLGASEVEPLIADRARAALPPPLNEPGRSA